MANPPPRTVFYLYDDDLQRAAMELAIRADAVYLLREGQMHLLPTVRFLYVTSPEEEMAARSLIAEDAPAPPAETMVIDLRTQ
jgi:hypothetical protein